MYLKRLFSIIVLCFFSYSIQAENMGVQVNLKLANGNLKNSSQSENSIEDLYHVIRKFPQAKIYIFSYHHQSTNTGSNALSSNSSAKFVKDRLIFYGLNKTKIFSYGYQATAVPAYQLKNRRRFYGSNLTIVFSKLDRAQKVVLKRELRFNKNFQVVDRLFDIETDYISSHSDFLSTNKNRRKKDFSLQKKEFSQSQSQGKALVRQKLHEKAFMGNSLAFLSSFQKTPQASVPNVNFKAKKVNRTVAQEKVEFQDAVTKKNRHSFGLGVYHNSLMAEDNDSGAKAEWVSKNNYELVAEVQRKLGQLWIGSRIGVHFQRYNELTNAVYSWNGKNPTLFRGSLTSSYQTQSYSFGLNIDFNNEVFINETNSQVELDRSLMVEISSELQYKWFDHKSWSSRAGLTPFLPLVGSGELDPKGQFGFLISLDLRKQNMFFHQNGRLLFYFGEKSFKNNENSQKEKMAGLRFLLDSDLWF